MSKSMMQEKADFGAERARAHWYQMVSGLFIVLQARCRLLAVLVVLLRQWHKLKNIARTDFYVHRFWHHLARFSASPHFQLAYLVIDCRPSSISKCSKVRVKLENSVNSTTINESLSGAVRLSQPDYFLASACQNYPSKTPHSNYLQMELSVHSLRALIKL